MPPAALQTGCNVRTAPCDSTRDGGGHSHPMSTADEMTCRELVEVVTDYLEGALPDDDRRRLEAHLEECPYCLEYVAQMRQTIDALGELPPEMIGEQRQRDLLAAFRGWRGA